MYADHRVKSFSFIFNFFLNYLPSLEQFVCNYILIYANYSASTLSVNDYIILNLSITRTDFLCTINMNKLIN